MDLTNKEIIIVDAFDNCLDCPEKRVRYDEYSGDIAYTLCAAIEDEDGWLMKYEGGPYNTKRPEWCPRRKIPKRQEVPDVGAGEYFKGIEAAYSGGWNACLDKIFGGGKHG